MRRVAIAAILVIATIVGAHNSAWAQPTVAPNNPLPPPTRLGPTPLVWYGIGATASEGGRMALSCFLGPVGWLLGPVLFPDPIVTTTPPPQNPPPHGTRQARGRHIDIPPRGVTSFVREVLLEFEAGTSAQYIAELARALQLTLLARQSFTLTGRTLLLFRIDGTGSVQDTLRLVQARYGRALAGQANFFYGFGQAQPPAPSDAAAQYVVPKLHLLEAHRITNGDDVLVAVIDSKIDGSHPDLAGVIADEYDALGGPAPAPMHGTGMAGAPGPPGQPGR